MVLHTKVRWSDTMADPAFCGRVIDDGGAWTLLLKVGVNAIISVKLTPGGTPKTGQEPVWTLERLSESVYALNPSVVDPRIQVQHDGRSYPFHAYVVLYDCPAGLNGYPETDRAPA